MRVKVFSTFSGISAASIAWKPLGWEFVGYAEPAPFPAHVLNARCGATAPVYRPEGKDFEDRLYKGISGGSVTNWGDVSQITDEDLRSIGPVDLLEGGSPCQAFSIAGARQGFSDARGNLTLMFVNLALRMRRLNGLKYVVWENVPGVLSHADNPLGCFLAALSGDEHPLLPSGDRWSNAGYVSSEESAIAWRVLDAQHFRRPDGDGLLPQRRKRVFAVVSFDPALDPGEVLFEREGEAGAATPCDEARQGSAGTRQAGIGELTTLCMDSAVSCDPEGIAYTVKASSAHNPQAVTYNILNAGRRGQDVSLGLSEADAPMYTVIAGMQHAVVHPLYSVGLGTNANGQGVAEEGAPMYTLTATDQHAVVHPAVVATLMACGAGTERVASAGNELDYVIVAEANQGYVARRIMPVEAERLQGFPGGHTDVPFNGKPPSDSRRYAACGNSMATPVMNWIGRRLTTCLHAIAQTPRHDDMAA
jgi:DNA (cytosine-5)-methyltransferase 1